MLNHDQAGRHVLELLADLLANPGPHGAAVGTRKLLGGDVVEFALARQMSGQWLAAVPILLGWARRSRSWRRVGRRRGFRCRGFPGRQDLAGEEQELSGVELLGLAAIPLTQELFELVLDFVDEMRLLGERLHQLADQLWQWPDREEVRRAWSSCHDYGSTPSV